MLQSPKRYISDSTVPRNLTLLVQRKPRKAQYAPNMATVNEHREGRRGAVPKNLTLLAERKPRKAQYAPNMATVNEHREDRRGAVPRNLTLLAQFGLYSGLV